MRDIREENIINFNGVFYQRRDLNSRDMHSLICAVLMYEAWEMSPSRVKKREDAHAKRLLQEANKRKSLEQTDATSKKSKTATATDPDEADLVPPTIPPSNADSGSKNSEVEGPYHDPEAATEPDDSDIAAAKSVEVVLPSRPADLSLKAMEAVQKIISQMAATTETRNQLIIKQTE